MGCIIILELPKLPVGYPKYDISPDTMGNSAKEVIVTGMEVLVAEVITVEQVAEPILLTRKQDLRGHVSSLDITDVTLSMHKASIPDSRIIIPV